MSSPTRLVAGGLVRRALRGEAARTVPHLLIRPPGGGERAVALPAELTVGRGPEAGLVLDDEGTSRLHARLWLAEDGVAAVEDLGSKNGIRLNGRPLGREPAVLRTGDELQVGATVLRFEDPLAGPSAAAEPAPAGLTGDRATAGAPPPGRPGGPPGAPGLLAGAAALLGLAALLLALG